MATEAAKRTYARIHEARPFHDGTFRNWSERATERTPFHYGDGVEIYVADHDVNPGDEFLTPPLEHQLSAAGPDPEADDTPDQIPINDD